MIEVIVFACSRFEKLLSMIEVIVFACSRFEKLQLYLFSCLCIHTCIQCMCVCVCYK